MATGLVACAADPESAGVESMAITNGTATDGDPAVVALLLGDTPVCTATLISDRVLLTAGHCALPGMRAFFGSVPGEAGIQIDIVDARPHPSFSFDGLVNDVAVLLLAEPAPAGITPIPLRSSPLGPSFVGVAIRLVGFGATGSAAEDEEPTRKREGWSVIESVEESTFAFGPSPSQTCVGDSGGPAFAFIDGVEVLIGVTSSGDAQCAAGARDMRVDVYAASFVLPYVAETSPGTKAVGERCYYDAHCDSASCRFPEDAPNVGYCSVSCSSSADCPPAMECASAQQGARECIYPGLSPGAFGAVCAADADCDSGVCAQSVGTAQKLCTDTCFGDLDELCPTGATCVDELDGPGQVCQLPAEPAGCNLGGGGDGQWWMTLAQLLLLRRRTRRCPM
jgi:hypothetical protein